MMPPITLLTTRPNSFARWTYNKLRSRKFQTDLRLNNGPTALQRNLIKGLEQLGIPYLLNPPAHQVTPNVGVLAGIDALEWAIHAKSSGKIKRLVAGPNLVVMPTDHDSIVGHEAIDVLSIPSQWAINLYGTMLPSLAPRIREWAVGVDTDNWIPNNTSFEFDFLIFNKLFDYRNSAILTSVLLELEKRKLKYTLITYGFFDPKVYRNLLHQSRSMIYLTESESQSIAQFEAWSTNVPTLVWDKGSIMINDHLIHVSSSPYLTDTKGMKFKEIAELSQKLDEFLAKLEHYSPRTDILEKYTLKSTAEQYVSFFDTNIG